MALVTAHAALPVRGASTRRPVSMVNSTQIPSRRRPESTPIRLTVRGRRVLAILALIPIVFALVVLGSHKASADSTTPATHSVKVQSGQSLWDVAVAVDPNTDPRATIWTIQQLNHMTTSDVVAGQGLIVPGAN